MKRMTGVYNIDQSNIQKEIDEYIQSTQFRESNIFEYWNFSDKNIDFWPKLYELGRRMVQLASYEAVCERFFCNRLNYWSAAEKQPRMSF
jgi:hypothetical protein